MNRDLLRSLDELYKEGQELRTSYLGVKIHVVYSDDQYFIYVGNLELKILDYLEETFDYIVENCILLYKAELREFLAEHYPGFSREVFNYVIFTPHFEFVDFPFILETIKIVTFIRDIDNTCKIDRLKKLTDDFYLWDKNLDTM